ncbi:MAG TPA: translation initiation factor IF-3 C-terminal domain-containing protein, partial [Candidatus Limnocylindrales bacterium]|nr:translation initiation factor IF-3 C-terminal domain-containing protein [Candidatus Limnocylindrales bacterium]
KVHRATEFLEDGDRIKVTVQFRGRELTHPEIGRRLLDRFVERIAEHGAVERGATFEGRTMHIIVASTHKPKTHEAGGAAKEPPEGHPESGPPPSEPEAPAAPPAGD